MKKQLSIIQLANIINMVPQYLYKVIKRPIAGQVYDKNAINYVELKRVLINKAGSEEKLNSILEIDSFDELVIVASTKEQRMQATVNLSEVVIGEEYTVKSYHYEVRVKLVDIREINNDKLYIFEHLNESKVNKDKYRVITESEFGQARYRIIANED